MFVGKGSQRSLGNPTLGLRKVPTETGGESRETKTERGREGAEGVAVGGRSVSQEDSQEFEWFEVGKGGRSN